MFITTSLHLLLFCFFSCRLISYNIFNFSHLAYAVLVVDACVELCTSKFLKWRMKLYRTLCASHISAGDWESAGRVAQSAKNAVLRLRQDEGKYLTFENLKIIKSSSQ